MASAHLKCVRCGRLNPPSVRTCLDCGTLLQRNFDAASPMSADEKAKRKREIDKSTGFDDIQRFYDEKADGRPEGERSGDGLREIERFDRDDAGVLDASLPGIERLGERQGPAIDADPIERSRAYEVETAPLVSDEPEEGSVRFAVDLETFDDATRRMSDVATEFQQKAKTTEQRPSAPPPGHEPRPVPLASTPVKPGPTPKHRAAWEKSDVEILGAIRRKAIVRGLVGTSIPLVAIGLVVIGIGRFLALPMFVPTGTWKGTMIDRVGDGRLTPFTLVLTRSGGDLRGRFWLAREAGGAFEAGTRVRVPYVLEGAYESAPVPVRGKFSRTGFTLTLGGVGGPRGVAVTWTGTFPRGGTAEGEAVSNRGPRAAWTMSRAGIF
jgi:hypothetical protein